METKKVRPCGFLFAGCEVYYLLSPEPVVADSWQDNGTYRFVCVPISTPDDGDIFSYARHVVTNSFTIEYRTDLKPIEILVLDQPMNYEKNEETIL